MASRSCISCGDGWAGPTGGRMRTYWGRAATEKIKADTDSVMIADGVISPEEARIRLAADPESSHHGLQGSPPDPPEQLDPDTDDDAGKVGTGAVEGGSKGANSGV